MTTLTLNLTATLQSTLTAGGASNGVSAYAVYFDTSGAANFTTLVDNGTLQSAGSYVINLPTMAAGKIYFLIQSQNVSEPYDLTTLITAQADINWANAATWGVRYDSFEFSLEGQTGDAGNLTSVESFGLPMEVEVEYQDGTGTVQSTATRGYNVSGSSFFTDLSGAAPGVLYTYTDGALAGDTRMAIGPATSVVPGSGSTSFQASDWNSYIDSLKTPSGTTGVFLSGFFNGAADANNVYHNPGYYSYELTWDPTHQNADNTVGTFWLSPTNSQISGYSTIAGFSQIQGYIQITPDQLANSIYSTLGSAYIYSDPTDAQPYNIALSPGAMNTGANNQWGAAVLTQLLTGFSAGYIGMSGTSLNAGVTQPIDLSNNLNWDPTYAFGQNLAAGDVPDHVDPYSNLFFLNTNSYGWNYSDNLMSAYSAGGPLISLYSPYSQTDVANINLTIFDDSETPTGYVTPTIDNYINTTFDPAVATTSGISIGMNFFNQMVMLDETTASITLRFQTADGWQELELSAAANTSTGNPGSLWDDWTIVQNGDGTFSISAGGNPQTTGSLVITNPPAPANGVGWYQIVVHDVDDPDGTAANAKTFNLYTTTVNSQFANPAYSGQAGALAVDGLALVAPQASSASTILTFAVDFLYSTTSTIDPSLLTLNVTDALSIFASMYGNGTLPTAPVVGDMSSGSFVAGTGQSTTTAPSSTLSSGELAFGWTGYNPLAWTTNTNNDPIGSSWISQYSNKIGGGNIARLTFAGTSLMPVAAVGDIDGQWLSGTHAFGNGTYTATFTEYLASDTVFADPLTPASRTLNFTVNVAEVDLLTAATGLALTLDDGGIVAGNWIRFETLSSGSGGLPPDATLILYATDASGNLVARDGTSGPGVTLSEATLGKIGNVLSDGDAQLLSGSQHVYLGAGQQLHFAVQSGSGAIDMAPDVGIDVQADGTADIHIGNFRLSAVSDNTLSGAAELASGQHRYDEALVYLTHGAMIEVELTGSSANTNTLGFVRFDVDAQGNLSVDGVAYGDSDAFRAAVVDSLDPGFLVARGGQSAFDEVWTVSGADGYYAPVLLTQNGDIFVPGTGNAGGHEYIRIFGQNTFGFEDLTAAQNSDFDYNDMAMKLTPLQPIF